MRTCDLASMEAFSVSTARLHKTFFGMRSWVLFSIANELAPLSCKSTFQKALSTDIAALEADALLGALLLKTMPAEAPAREVLHARLEKLKGVLDTHWRVGERLEVGDACMFH